MEYVFATLLLHKAGKEINEKNLTEVLTAAGINADPVRIKVLVASLGEVDIDKAIKTPPAFITTTPASATPTPSPKEKLAKKEKTKEEVEGLEALFTNNASQ